MNASGLALRCGGGALALAASVAVMTLLLQAGLALPGAGGGFAFAVAAGIWAGRATTFGGWLGAVLCLFATVAPLIETDIAIFGRDLGTLRSDELPGHRFAAVVRLADVRVASEYEGVVEQTAKHGGGEVTGGWFAAPLVGQDWTPSQPVPAWVLGRTDTYDPGFRARRHWREPPAGAVFHTPNGLAPTGEAVERAMAKHKLASAPGAPLLYVAADPDAVIAAERAWLFGAALVFIAQWCAELIGEALVARARGRNPPAAYRSR